MLELFADFKSKLTLKYPTELELLMEDLEGGLWIRPTQNNPPPPNPDWLLDEGYHLIFITSNDRPFSNPSHTQTFINNATYCSLTPSTMLDII